MNFGNGLGLTLVTVLTVAAAQGPATAVPVAAIGHSSDPWDGASGKDPFSNSCKWVIPPFVTTVPAVRRSRAVEMLADVPAVELAARDGVELLDLDRAAVDARGLTSAALDLPRGDMERRKFAAERTHRGSWSLADEDNLEALTAAQARTPPLKAVMIRALSFSDSTKYFSAQVCGDAVRVHGWAPRKGPGLPARIPVVLFLEAVPKDVYVIWTISAGGPP